MNIAALYDYCLELKGATEHFPFDEDTLVFKVGGKIFVFASLSDWEQDKSAVAVKCDPEEAVDLRERYQAVNPGYHMNKKHWNTVFFHQDVNDRDILAMIKKSYDLVYASLPKKVREQI